LNQKPVWYPGLLRLTEPRAGSEAFDTLEPARVFLAAGIIPAGVIIITLPVKPPIFADAPGTTRRVWGCCKSG
jgi:hypothetical protein